MGKKPLLCDECQFRIGDTHMLIPKKVIKEIENKIKRAEWYRKRCVHKQSASEWYHMILAYKEVLAMLKKQKV